MTKADTEMIDVTCDKCKGKGFSSGADDFVGSGQAVTMVGCSECHTSGKSVEKIVAFLAGINRPCWCNQDPGADDQCELCYEARQHIEGCTECDGSGKVPKYPRLQIKCTADVPWTLDNEKPHGYHREGVGYVWCGVCNGLDYSLVGPELAAMRLLEAIYQRDYGDLNPIWEWMASTPNVPRPIHEAIIAAVYTLEVGE